MRIKTSRADAFLAAPPVELRAVLLFGTDAGLIRERALALTAKAAEQPDDPFRVVEVEAEILRGDPGRLLREAAQMPLTGGRRVVRLRRLPALDDKTAKALLADYLAEAPEGALLVVEGGDMLSRSPLVTAFERQANAAAIECYRDEDRTLRQMIQGVIQEAGRTASASALDYLEQQLGGDRQVTRQELGKLLLFLGDRPRIELEDAMVTVGDSTALSLEELAFAVGEGDREAAARLGARALAEGQAPVALLRALARHYERLQRARYLLERGETAETAMGKLRPPVFWKQKERFVRQLARIGLTESEQVLKALLKTEASCKTTGAADGLLVADLILRLTGRNARRLAARPTRG